MVWDLNRRILKCFKIVTKWDIQVQGLAFSRLNNFERPVRAEQIPSGKTMSLCNTWYSFKKKITEYPLMPIYSLGKKAPLPSQWLLGSQLSPWLS